MTAGESGLAQIRASLDDLLKAFEFDGYLVTVDAFDGERIAINIKAQEGACAECLVPPPIMEGIIRTKLPAAFAQKAISLAYPSAH